MINKKEPLFSILGVPVYFSSEVLISLANVFGLAIWVAGYRQPERSWLKRLVVAILSTLVASTGDMVHVAGHIISAQKAEAPMDKVRLWFLPQTLYNDNDVSPQKHCIRAIGGPIASGLSFSMSLFLRALTVPRSLLRELADWLCVAHGFIFFGSFFPFPMVDGGVLLKWTLVEKGHTPAKADEVVEKANLATGTVALASGTILATKKRWLPAAIAVVVGLFSLGIGFGKIKLE